MTYDDVHITREVRLPAQEIYDLSTDKEFEDLLKKLPGRVRVLVERRIREVEEIKMQAHAPVEVLYRHAHVIYPEILGPDDLKSLDTIGQWRTDGRLGLEGALHRFGRLDTNQHTSLVTVRVGKAYVGVAEALRPWLDKAQRGLVIIGRPGSGKTVVLRDSMRILSERLAGRFFVGDSSNELLGDGFKPHQITGWMSRVAIGDPQLQYDKLNQMVKNFQPRWIAVDEISALQDARAIAYARSRDVMAVMTWHAGTLQEAYAESTERVLWPLIRRDEKGITGPPVSELGILIRSRGDYLIFEDLGRAFQQIEQGEKPDAIHVNVEQAGRWTHRSAVAV